MPPALTDYTYALGDSGQILNTDSMGLPFFDVTQVSGLDGAPLRISTDEHQGMDGTYIDSPFMSSRSVIITGTLYTDPNLPEAFLDQLRADYESDTIRPFYFQHPGQGVRYINGQGGGCVYDVSTGRRIGQQDVQLTVLCADPYIYAWPPSVDSVSVPTIITVGMSFNAAFNLGFGGSVPSLTATVYNNGTHTAYPYITIMGACVNPTFSDGFGVTMPFNLTMSSTDILTIDCRTKNVILNGQQSRRSAMSGLQWFSVPKQSSSTILFAASSGTATATVSLNSTYY